MGIGEVLIVNRLLMSGMLLHTRSTLDAPPCNRPRTHLIFFNVVHGTRVESVITRAVLLSSPDNIVVVNCARKVSDEVLEQSTA